ncbi:MAG: NAD(P)/FAD-dependent oxidoreductase [Chloroflexota bacterium]|nr:NAD(P)/FAD-dependent oxidoreductase [Chloroflexota bacterium]
MPIDEDKTENRSTGSDPAMERRTAQVLIIGCGAAGLSAAGALKRLGLAATVLERDEVIGGTWARRYDRLHLHTIRQLSGMAHLPMPRHYPRYISRDQFVRYLQSYAMKLRIDVRTGCEVKSITPLSTVSGPAWQVETNQGMWQSKTVVLATGQYRVPRMPTWPGCESFSGQLVHSSDYRNGHAWTGKRALIIGVGNSGAEIATDMADAGATFVAVSIRTPPFITRRDTLGLPVQLVSFLLSLLPPQAADTVARNVMRISFGNLSRHGIAATGYSPYSDQHVPLIDVGFVKAVKQRRLIVRPEVASFTPLGVRFSDGREEAFDYVVAATGFSSGLEQLLPLPDMIGPEGFPNYPSGEPTPQPGLYFTGFTHSLRGHLFEANRSSRRLARHIAAYMARAGA